MLFGLFARNNIKKQSDTDLVLSIIDGNKDAEGEIFIRYSGLAMGLCLKYMKDINLAEDTMMNLFEKLPAKIKKSQINNFKNWLYSVCRNECLMALRKKNLNTGEIENSLKYQEDDSAKKLEEVLNTESNIIALEEALKKLKTEQRECIRLFYLKDMSYNQITAKTGFDLKKVKSYIQNGKRNLKKILEKQGGF